MTKEHFIKLLNKFSLSFLAIGLLICIYIVSHGLGLTDGSYGPGSYYYTDIPGWEKIFHGEDSITINVKNPLLIMGIFFFTGYGYFKLWQWLDHRIK